MTIQEAKNLLTVAAEHWETRQVIVFDWYDGPKEGICELNTPQSCFYFQLLAERRDEEDLNDRLFKLSILPCDALHLIYSLLSPLGEPSSKVWVPIWNFNDKQTQRNVDQQIEAILTQKKDTEIVFRTRDMQDFMGRWKVRIDDLKGDDLFAFLELD